MRFRIILFFAVLGLLINGCSNEKVHTQSKEKSKDKVSIQDKVKTCSENDFLTSMATIPKGPFMMGCNALIDENCSYIENEIPYHKVEVPEYKIDFTEVTVGQYRACVEDNGRCPEPSMNWNICNWAASDRETHPMNCINWYEAKAYCKWSGKRLCSESEWEKAARGTDGRMYPWGNERATCKQAIMRKNGVWGCGKKRTWPVGSKPPGVYGIYDMAGNVSEWVEDDWHWDYEGAPDNGKAWVRNPRTNRGVRGGNFIHFSLMLRVSKRRFFEPGKNFNGSIGVRCCK